jgi:hypothetical protein
MPLLRAIRPEYDLLSVKPERTDEDGKTQRTVEYPPGEEKSFRNRLAQGRGRDESQGPD